MTVPTTEAKNKFDAICAQAKIGPDFIEKDGCPESVILSIDATTSGV